MRALLVAAALLLAARAAPLAPAPQLDAACGSIAVRADSTGAFADACGRQRLFRGVNVVQKAFPWLPRLDAFDPFTSLAPADLPFMRSFGVNSMRLGAMWPGFEPSPGSFNASYLAELTRVVVAAGAAGIYSLLDAHQDALSGATCGEGIPDGYAIAWAKGVPAFPEPLKPAFPLNGSEPSAGDCATVNWSDLYFTRAVGAAFQFLYTQEAGLAAFGAFWNAVARAVTGDAAADPYVLGIDLLNEPWAGDTNADPLLLIPGVADLANLQPFFNRIGAAYRAGEARSHHPLFLSAVTWDDFIPVGFTELPGAGGGRDTSGGAVLSYHYYSYVNLEGAAGQVAIRVSDARRLKAGAMLTEFDFAQDAGNMTALLDACDARQQGYITWEYKMFDPITGSDTGAFLGNGSVNLYALRAFARTFPEAVAGAIQAYAFDRTSGDFSLSFAQDGAVNASTVIYACTEFFYPQGVSVTVAGPATWTIEAHEPPPPAQRAPGARFPDPTPLRWAHVLITRIEGAPALANVTVTIKPRR